jgi:hypothetical protein
MQTIISLPHRVSHESRPKTIEYHTLENPSRQLRSFLRSCLQNLRFFNVPNLWRSS